MSWWLRVLGILMFLPSDYPGGAACAGEDLPRLTAAQFPILAWNRTRGDRGVYRDIHACGFNLAGFVPPDDLDLVAGAGLQCFVDDPLFPVSLSPRLTDAEVGEKVVQLARKYGHHPAVYGFFLADEPSAGAFPQLAMWATALRAVMPHHIPYVNLFPNYADSTQLGIDNYARYVEAFLARTELPYLSYDHYALMEDGTLRGGYFENLEIIRRAALRHDVPFWQVVLATGCLNYAEPTEAGLRFQAYTSLAYGARGLGWFTYFAQPVGNFRNAAVDLEGRRTPTWDMLRRVNMQIHRLGREYLSLTSVNVFHHPDPPPGCLGLNRSFLIRDIRGGRFVIGEFRNRQQDEYVLLVNCDLNRSARPEIDFKGAVMPVLVSALTGQAVPMAGEQVWLAPGQGALVRLVRDPHAATRPVGMPGP